MTRENGMGYKLKRDVKDYFNTLTTQDIKEAFEAYGFEVEESPDGLYDPSIVFQWKEPSPKVDEIVYNGKTYVKAKGCVLIG